ncbi:MAG: ATP-binding protein [Chloroflexi bacterium]|nr:MAG: ATP-binding protein [Chloroflexota bacterium]TME92610.1 MAG: ATP-binding protein [Chloroflexota bacterium]
MTSEFSTPFEFHATLTSLDDALDTLHDSIRRLRERTGGAVDDTNVMLFESALAEIGANVLTHGRLEGPADAPIEYLLRLEGHTALATFTDRGPPLHNHLTRAMPEPYSEAGRGLAIARQVLDELGYEREGDINTWRLVKRL